MPTGPPFRVDRRTNHDVEHRTQRRARGERLSDPMVDVRMLRNHLAAGRGNRNLISPGLTLVEEREVRSSADERTAPNRTRQPAQRHIDLHKECSGHLKAYSTGFAARTPELPMIRS